MGNIRPGNVKSFMRNGSIMISGKEYELGSRKYGKGKTFNHISTNFIFFLR